MALETGTWVDDLVTSNPPGSDQKSQGDDHIRLLKTVLKNTFPNATRAFRFPTGISKTANYTITASDDNSTVYVDASSGAITITLPTTASVPSGFRVGVMKSDSSANIVTVDGNGAELINNGATRQLSQRYQSEVYESIGSDWKVIFNVIPVQPINQGGTGATTASGARTNLGLAIGSDVQAFDAQLADIAALAVANGNFIVGNGANWVAESGATARASLGLGTLATLSSINNANWSGTDLALANGGTGSSTAAGARSNLGAAASGAVGSSDITMITNRLLGRTTAGTGAIEQITVGARLTLSGGSLTADDQLTAGSVAQAELKTTTGDVSSGAPSTRLTLPGGEYGFYPRVRAAFTTDDGGAVMGVVGNNADEYARLASFGFSVFTTLITLDENGTSTVFARQRYVQASPPYDLGDGEIDGSFIFAMVDALGDVVGMYQAPEPPWALNGPTSISPDRVDKLTGKKYKRVANLTVQALRSDQALLADFMAGNRDVTESEIEITHAIKNADMSLIPHPFLGNDLTGRTVVLIDPMSPLMRRLHALQQAGENILELFSEGKIKVDNEELGRSRPPGVMSVAAKL